MKILYITNQICGSGGLERVLALKTEYLINDFNYNVHILTLNQDVKENFYYFNSKIKHHNIEVVGNPFKYFFKYIKGMKKIMAEIEPDIISVCDDGLKGFLFPVFFEKKSPIIYERHASVNLNFTKKNKHSIVTKFKNYFQHKLMLYGANKFDSFVILTNGNKIDWPNVTCTVIPNPSPFKPEDNLNEKENIVLAVGSQSYNKGYDRLIEVWKKVSMKFPNWVLKVYGKKNKELKLQERVNELKINKNFILNSPIKNINEQYKKASIFVMPSRSEGFGMVLIEAMNYGVPCVSFNCPHGPEDIITDKKDGFLIQNGDINAFADAVIRLIENEEERKEMGVQAKESVKRYAPEKIMNVWDELFKSLLKK